MLVARKQGYRSMLEDGRTKVLNGWTTPDEVLRAVYTQAMD
jgi:type II secretory ATPase GspE/PulE/Tfp pilus assembly ATPase PilB-like protein